MLAKTPIRDILWDQQKGLCFWCGELMHNDCDRKSDADFASIEHVIPRSWGGKNSRANLRLAHKRCNTMRNAKLKLPLHWVQMVHALLLEARGYLDGMEIAQQIDAFMAAMQRMEATSYETIRSSVQQETKHGT